jgi:hypothetical protein
VTWRPRRRRSRLLERSTSPRRSSDTQTRDGRGLERPPVQPTASARPVRNVRRPRASLAPVRSSPVRVLLAVPRPTRQHRWQHPSRPMRPYRPDLRTKWTVWRALDASDTRVTRLRAWSRLTGWRFESSSAHLKALQRGAFFVLQASRLRNLRVAWQRPWQHRSQDDCRSSRRGSKAGQLPTRPADSVPSALSRSQPICAPGVPV